MTTAVDTELRLSATELDACWEVLRLGDPPLTLSLPSPGRTWAERHRLVGRILGELARRGLAEGTEPDRRLAEALRLLDRPEHQVDLRLCGDPYGEIVGLGAVAGERATVLFQRGELIRILPVRPAQVGRTLLEAAGSVRPGAGRSVNIPVEVYDQAKRATRDAKLWTMADELVRRGVASGDAGAWARMCTGVRSFGQLGTSVWREGVHRLGPWVIGFHRTDLGHYLQLRRPDPGAPPDVATLTVSPVDGARLLTLVDELVAETG